MQLENRDGVFIEFKAFKDILAAHEHDLGELRNETAAANVAKAMSDAEAKAYKHAAEQQIWRATWGPVIGGVIGFGAGAGAVGLGAAILDAIRR